MTRQTNICDGSQHLAQRAHVSDWASRRHWTSPHPASGTAAFIVL